MIEVVTEFDRTLNKLISKLHRNIEHAQDVQYYRACLSAEQGGEPYPSPPVRVNQSLFHNDFRIANAFPTYVNEQINVRRRSVFVYDPDAKNLHKVDRNLLVHTPPYRGIINPWPFAFLNQTDLSVDTSPFSPLPALAGDSGLLLKVAHDAITSYIAKLPDKNELSGAQTKVLKEALTKISACITQGSNAVEQAKDHSNLLHIANRVRRYEGWIWVWPEELVPSETMILRYYPDPLGEHHSQSEKPKGRTDKELEADKILVIAEIEEAVRAGEAKTSRLGKMFELIKRDRHIYFNSSQKADIRKRVDQKLKDRADD